MRTKKFFHCYETPNPAKGYWEEGDEQDEFFLPVMAFVSRHEPTEEQIQLAFKAGYALEGVGDIDAFEGDLSLLKDYGAVAVVHPWLALRLCLSGFDVGVFRNAQRQGIDGKPSFVCDGLFIEECRYQPACLADSVFNPILRKIV